MLCRPTPPPTASSLTTTVNSLALLLWRPRRARLSTPRARTTSTTTPPPSPSTLPPLSSLPHRPLVPRCARSSPPLPLGEGRGEGPPSSLTPQLSKLADLHYCSQH